MLARNRTSDPKAAILSLCKIIISAKAGIHPDAAREDKAATGGRLYKTVIPVKAGIQYFPWTCSVLAAPPFQGSYTNQRLSMGPAASPGYSDGDVAVLARRQPIFMLSCHSSESGNPVFPRTRASHTIESQRWATFIHLHAYIFRDARGLRGCLSAVTAGTASGYGTREYDREFFKRLRPCR